MAGVVKILFSLLVLGSMAILAARLIFALPEDRGEPSAALPPATAGRLADALEGPLDRHQSRSGVTPLARGAEAFAARVLLADAAVSSIDAQYYIWHDDLTGLLLFDALNRAADRGVRVRLLLDDNGTSGVDAHLAALDAHPMIEVRLWNPFNLRGRLKPLSYAFDFPRLNRRMHNKSFTVDGLATIVGGRNVGDEYFGTGRAPLYVDLDVLAVGDVVPDVSADFDRYWAAPAASPAGPIVGIPPQGDPVAEALDRARSEPRLEEYRNEIRNSEIVARMARGDLDFEWTDAVLVSDDPAKGEGGVPRERSLVGALDRTVGHVTSRFDGVSPYFVPGERGVALFASLEAKGVEVRMLTNSLAATDVLPVHAGYAKRRRALLNAGVELYELRREAAAETSRDDTAAFGASGASLHAKTFAVDGERIYVGSFNFDPRSIHLNTEMGLLIDSEAMAGHLGGVFDRGVDGLAWQVRTTGEGLIWTDPSDPDAPVLAEEPGSSPARRIALTVIGWLPVEWLL